MASLLTYRDIADDLQRRIRAGEYPPGSAIPSYRGLSRLYGKSISTVQRAVGLLEDRRVVKGRPGVGVFAQYKAPRAGSCLHPIRAATPTT